MSEQDVVPFDPQISDEVVRLIAAHMQPSTDSDGIGLIGYDLRVPMAMTVPIEATLRNMTPRRSIAVDVDHHHWKAISRLQVLNGELSYDTVTAENGFQTLEVSQSVTIQVSFRGVSLERDVRARRYAELLHALALTEERWLWGWPAPFVENLPQPHFDGLLSQGERYGAVVLDLAQGRLVKDDLDTLLRRVFTQGQNVPDMLLMHQDMANEVRRILNLDPRVGLESYPHPDQETQIPVYVAPYCPADTIVAVPLHFPMSIPGFEDHVALEVLVQTEGMGLEFAPTPTMPVHHFQVISNVTLCLYFPAGMGILRGIAA